MELRKRGEEEAPKIMAEFEARGEALMETITKEFEDRGAEIMKEVEAELRERGRQLEIEGRTNSSRLCTVDCDEYREYVRCYLEWYVRKLLNSEVSRKPVKRR